MALGNVSVGVSVIVYSVCRADVFRGGIYRGGGLLRSGYSLLLNFFGGEGEERCEGAAEDEEEGQ